MAAFQLYRKTQSFYGNSGQLLAGGNLKFYLTGTATLKNVYAEKALTTNNGSTITLDSSGRANVAIWGDGSYDVKLYDVDNVLQGQDLLVESEAGPSSTLPALVADQFLTNNGTAASWAAIRQVPDPTGSAGKVLGNDGALLLWQAAAAAVTLPDGGVLQDGTSITVGKMKLKLGTGTAPSSGAHTTSVAITFGVTYSAAPKVFIAPLENSVTPNGYSPVFAVKSLTTTGCTVHFDVNSDLVGASYNINTAIPFDWLAVGVIP